MVGDEICGAVISIRFQVLLSFFMFSFLFIFSLYICSYINGQYTYYFVKVNFFDTILCYPYRKI